MKDRSMATAAYPKTCTRRAVVIEGSWSGGSYRSYVAGYRMIIHMSDGSELQCCTGSVGHKKQSTLVACATRKVDRLNDAAGIPEAA